ncbi:hypothetical protein GCM10010977_16430 [Citricoccus zhacaiensis]|uniref:Uncharacterized protein n=1 Tax=Citricoccus zhacaiensis TaxID=489142 RepID=A0ABQ2LZ39_9MICC|nr:hypothetical protein GCM10010977_16430 [Citricoccus zhacaiensis]
MVGDSGGEDGVSSRGIPASLSGRPGTVTMWTPSVHILSMGPGPKRVLAAPQRVLTRFKPAHDVTLGTIWVSVRAGPPPIA